MKWTRKEIGDIGKVVGGGTPNTSNDEYFDGDIPWITPKDLSSHKKRYVYEGERSLTKQGLDNSSARLLPPGTVLLTSRAPVGYLAIAGCELATNQGFKSIIPGDDFLPEFLYYSILSNLNKIKKLASGSTFKEISGSDLGNIEIDVAGLKEQERVANILGSLDDFVDNNINMNDKLEKTAFYTYQYIISNSAKSEGKITRISEVCSLIGGSTPSTGVDEYWEGGDITWFTPSDVTNKDQMYLERSDRTITEKGLESCSTNYIPPESVMMTSRATVGEAALNVDKACTNQGFINIMASENTPISFLYMWVKYNKTKIQKRASGSTFPEIPQKDFKNMSIFVPKERIIQLYKEYTDPLFQKSKNNILLNNRLNTLIEKLISYIFP